MIMVMVFKLMIDQKLATELSCSRDGENHICERVENFRQMWESVDWQFNALATISQILISIDNQI